MFKILVFIFSFSMSSILLAENLKFLSVDFPPYTYQTPTGGAGAMYDVVQEISKRLKTPAAIEFVPWTRARFEAENKPNIAIMPLARTAEREHLYTWLIHVLDDPYVLITLKNSKFDISSFKTAKDLKIGILAGSVADVLLRKMGFTNLELGSTDIQNVKKLKLGRIDAWVAPYSCRGRYVLEGGLGDKDLRAGLELTILHEYLGASKSLDAETVKEWQKAFASMKKDGSYAAIMKKYGIKPLD